jgi:hypothetical protein
MSFWFVLAWLAILSIPVLIVFFAAVTAFRRLWVHTPVLAPLFGTIGTAFVSWLAFGAYWVHPVVGLVMTSAVVASSVAVFAHGGLWRRWRPAVPLLALVAGSLVFSIAFAYLWGAGSDPYTVIQNRFFYFTLPVDNTIPRLFTDHLLTNQGTHALIGDWNGGDRPPLQAGFELVFSPLVAAGQAVAALAGGTAVGGAPIAVTGLGGTMPLGATFALDVLAQCLWVPAGYGLLRILGFRSWVSVGALVLASLIPTMLVNTLFTWPKMMSAALVLTSIAFLFATRRANSGATWTFVFAVVAAAFAVLAHGAAAFAIPALVIIGLYSLRGRGVRASFTPIALGATFGILLYLPWLAYQRFVDPPGDRLLKWHLAGVTTPTPDSFADVLVAQYSALPLHEAVTNRLEGLATIFGLDQGRLILPLGHVTDVGLRTADWTSTLFALGLVALISIVAMLIWSGRRFRTLDSLDKQRLLLIGSMVLCIVVWWLVLFLPNATIVAQGSQSWMLVLALVPFAWLLERAPRIGWALIVVQAAALVGVYFGVVLIGTEPGALSVRALVVAALALVWLIVAPLALARRADVAGRPGPDGAERIADPWQAARS